MNRVEIHRDSAYWEIGLDALDMKNYVAVNYTLIRKYGLHAAVMIGELASEARYWKEKGKLEEGWFFSTVENVEKYTGLNAYFQRETLKTLQEIGIVEVKYSGLPRKRYVRVNPMRLIEEMTDDGEIADDGQCSTQSITRDEHSSEQVTDTVNDNNLKEQPKQTTKKKERKKPAETFDSIIAERTDNPELAEALGEFIRMRDRIKRPLTNYALKLRLNTLWRLGKTDDERIAIVNQSVGACWQDFYELKEDGQHSATPRPSTEHRRTSEAFTRDFGDQQIIDFE